MLKANWQRLKLGLFGVIFISTVSVAIRIIFQSQPPTSSAPKITFPESIPLPQWQYVNSSAWETDTNSSINGWQYQYTRSDRQLEIRMRYLPVTEGNISRLLQVHADIPPATVQIDENYREEIGYYGFFVYEEQANLVACINPYGNSTVTEQQFAQNLSAHGFKFDRLLPWIFGHQDLINRSCLFTLLSMPVDSSALDESAGLETSPELESAWVNWYQWWEQNFPEK